MRIVIALTALLLGGCSGDQPAEKARLSGVVRIGPTPGPCIVNMPCSQPIGGVELVISRAGDDEVRATTDQRGRYAVMIEPGRYRIRAANYPSPARINTTAVTVVTDTRLNITIDSGVR